MLISCLGGCSLQVVAAELPALDLRRAEQAGVRMLAGQHLRLFTDLPPQAAVDELPAVFDAAVGTWAAYFGVAAERTELWQVRGFLIQDRQRFAALGVLPAQRPNFPQGFATERELWLLEQPSAYYRRHLLLHEGTHAFMLALLGGTGPGWYAEGLAELWGTHTWQDGQLTLRTMPADRHEVPMWGRIKSIREAHQAGAALSLAAVLALDQRRSLTTTEYAWCWSFCKFLDAHPRWQNKFRQLPQHVNDSQFNQRFQELYHAEWSDLQVEWQALVADWDYGYDHQQLAMQHREPQPVGAVAKCTLAAEKGWQSTGWLLKAGQQYRITATGRYQIAHDTQPWPCEPGGVTLAYHAGYPLGMLLGALRGQHQDNFSPPTPIGLGATLRPEQDAVLYLRVNDSPAGWHDNRGEIFVRLAPSQGPK